MNTTSRCDCLSSGRVELGLDGRRCLLHERQYLDLGAPRSGWIIGWTKRRPPSGATPSSRAALPCRARQPQRIDQATLRPLWTPTFGRVRLSDLEPRFVCRGCGGRGAEVRPDFDRGDPQLAIMGYRNTQ
jgi:hypothetical protein